MLSLIFMLVSLKYSLFQHALSCVRLSVGWQPNKEFQCGRVSAAELVQADQEMLSTAGINVDLEKQSLLQTTLILQEQLKESQATLLLEQVCVLLFSPDWRYMSLLFHNLLNLVEMGR